MSILVPILASTILGVSGQLALKIGMTRLGPVRMNGRNLVAMLTAIATNYFVVGGLLVYGLGVFFWLIALSRAPLSYAYPFASLNYVLIVLVSFVVLREKISWLRILGVVIICAGVLLAAFS